MRTSFLYFFYSNKIQFCEYNIDCLLPKMCCEFPFVKYCCYHKDYTLKPIPVRK